MERNPIWLALVAALCAWPTAAPAQDTGKQVRIIVGSIGGTGPDFIARLIAPQPTSLPRR